MKKKNLRLQAGDLIKHTKEKLSSEFVELSEKDLQQIVGGVAFGGIGSYEDKRHIPIYNLEQIVGSFAFGGSGGWEDR